jgi:hypothetical protein
MREAESNLTQKAQLGNARFEALTMVIMKNMTTDLNDWESKHALGKHANLEQVRIHSHLRSNLLLVSA